MLSEHFNKVSLVIHVITALLLNCRTALRENYIQAEGTCIHINEAFQKFITITMTIIIWIFLLYFWLDAASHAIISTGVASGEWITSTLTSDTCQCYDVLLLSPLPLLPFFYYPPFFRIFWHIIHASCVTYCAVTSIVSLDISVL